MQTVFEGKIICAKEFSLPIAKTPAPCAPVGSVGTVCNPNEVCPSGYSACQNGAQSMQSGGNWNDIYCIEDAKFPADCPIMDIYF